MRQIRRVGAAAAGVLVVAVLGTGCGGGSSDGASAAPTVVSETPAVEVTDTELPFSTEDPYATEEPTYPPGPEGDIDRLADEKGWSTDGAYDSASAFVQDMCTSLPTSGVEMSSRPQWLAEGHYLDGDGKAILQAGIPKLCPKWTATLKQAVSGKYERWFGNGTYVVSSKPAKDGEDETIPPGTYQAVGKMDGCYWERTTEGGEIIDNNFATSARRITVTIRSSDGQFTSERCEVWKPVR
ncbi:hypothetical protein ACH4TP_38100 [Streptomyces sp. NPDC021012]|uniref:hypothetical protein n=1 Tax=Streptomyces sp. NPDC021012 TaxID=3365107 RepID=UPI0037A8FA70